MHPESEWWYDSSLLIALWHVLVVLRPKCKTSYVYETYVLIFLDISKAIPAPRSKLPDTVDLTTLYLNYDYRGSLETSRVLYAEEFGSLLNFSQN